MPISLEDIARACGLAKSTVSKALAGRRHVSAATRAQVRETAATLGYVRDPQLAKIAAFRWRAARAEQGSRLAILYHNHEELSRERPEARRLAPGERAVVSRIAAGWGYALEVCEVNRRTDFARLGRVLHHRGVEGILLHTLLEARVRAAFPWEHFSIVGMIGSLVPLPCHRVGLDNGDLLQRAHAHALHLGAKRPGLILFTEAMLPDRPERIGAYLHACWQHRPESRPLRPLLIDPLYVSGRDLYTDPGVLEAVRRWHARERPDAIIGLNMTFYWLLRHAISRCPALDRFISLEPQPESPHIPQFLPNTELLAGHAVQLLDQLIRRRERGLPTVPLRVSLPAEFTPGI